MPSVIELLRTVVGTGETVALIYNGGSRPGQARPVIPLLLSEDELVATEPGSPVKKTYKIDRIASVELSSGLRAISPLGTPQVKPGTPKPETLTSYVQHFRSELIAAGWHLYEEEASFGIATRFKNGKPKKTPSVLIRYFDPSTETFLDPESGGLRTQQRGLTGRERPWRVDSWRFKEGRTFSQLEHAFALFIQEALASNPATAKLILSGH
jgi:hypothetical protein